MSEAKFQVGEYVQLVNLGSGNSPQYERTFAKVLTNCPATNPDNGYYYDVEVHDGRTKGLFERRLQKLPKGTEVQVTATINCIGKPVPSNTVGTIEHTSDGLYGIRTSTSRYHGVNCTKVQPVLTTQTSATTREETTMEAQVTTTPETLVGKRVKIRKSSSYYPEQGRTTKGKRRKGQVVWRSGVSGWVRVQFDDGYRNGYPITDLKIIKDEPKVPKFVPEAVTSETPVGTKVRVTIENHYASVGAVGILERHEGDQSPKIRFDNDYWFASYFHLETVHPDTAITKDNGDAAL